MPNYVIFSIDNATDTHTQAKFLRFMDTKRVMSELQMPPVSLIGKYLGKLEHSFMCEEQDFLKYVLPYGWVDGQDCVMVVWTTKAGNMMAYFRGISSVYISPSAPLEQVSAEEAFKSDGFTYRPDLDIYWVVR